MNLEADRYLKIFKAQLKDIPEQEKSDIVHEIETHITVGLSKQEPIENILDNLGKPEKLALSYKNEYLLNGNSGKPSLIWSILFYGFAGLSGLIIILSLSIIAITFAICGVTIPVVGLTNLFGISDVAYMVITPSYTLPPLLALVVGIVVGVVLLLMAFLCWKGLVKYCRSISGMYHKTRVKS